MALSFREAVLEPLKPLTAQAPSGAVIGVIGEDGSGKSALLQLAAGVVQPSSGEVYSSEPRRLVALGDPLNLGPAGVLALDHALARNDALVRARCLMALERLRQAGTTILFASHDQELIRGYSDEVWWLREGQLAARGDPREVLDRYHRHIARRLAEWGRSISQPLTPSLRRGDGRAELVSIQTLDAEDRPAMCLNGGEQMGVRVGVRFSRDVPNPVVGILIRTRIGFEVYGTNTELEGIEFGPVEGGTTVEVTFRFPCGLCPQDYTVTAASHDSDGVWHDWMEDAVAFTVADSRHTAGVARLSANVEVKRIEAAD